MGSFSNDDDEGIGRGRKRPKSNGLVKQNNNFARESRFFVHFFAVTARLRREIPDSTLYGGRKTSDDECFFLFLNLSAFLKKSTQGKFAYICHFQRIEINATMFEKRERLFKLAFSLPSSLLKLPNSQLFRTSSTPLQWFCQTTHLSTLNIIIVYSSCYRCNCSQNP